VNRQPVLNLRQLCATASAVLAGFVNVTVTRRGSSVKFGPALKPGDPAPDFSLMGSDGRIHSLRDHSGRRAVVLAWFPKAFTGG
jgi:hypothetical protein